MLKSKLGAARRAIASKTLPAPHFAYTPVMAAGDFAFVSGMVALDATTGQLIDGDAYQQTRRILKNLQSLVDELGWSLDQLALARLFFVGDAFKGANQAWEEVFQGGVPPARTSVGVSSLPLGALVEIEFQFFIA